MTTSDETRDRRIMEAVLSVPAGPEYPCPYLPGRTARDIAFLCDELDPVIYHTLMNAGFRRSGKVLYRPNCVGCRECVLARVEAARFRPSRSQRRVRRKNADVEVEIGPPHPTRTKWEVFRAYLEHQHDRTMEDSYEGFVRFLYESPVDTREIVYRIGGKVTGISIVDQCDYSLSSVYMYFDPDYARRSPGVFSVLWEIDYCRRVGIPYYYLGFYVRDCASMSYKTRFKPHELLSEEGRWVVGEDG